MAKSSNNPPSKERYGDNVIRVHENPKAGVPGHLAAFFMGAVASIDFSALESAAATAQEHKYEKARKGSGLPTYTHTFPRKSIARFCANGVVSLHDKIRNLNRPATPNDAIFCARRAWDKRSEVGYMKRIEDDFQLLAEDIIANCITEIDNDRKPVVDNFFALWYMRPRFKYLPALEFQAKGIHGEKYTQQQEEVLEGEGILFARKGGRVPTRQINGLRLQFLIRGYAEHIGATTQWGMIQAQEGQFIVPDIPVRAVIPVTPTLCLVSIAPNGTILKENVGEINRQLKADSREYFFANDLSMCPC